MQFRQIAALAGSALVGSLAAVAPAMAISVSKVSEITSLVTKDSFPVFVVGKDAKPEDVAGAINIAANFASFAKETTTVSVAGATPSITGGVSMATGSNPSSMWDNLAGSKQTLGGTDLPTVLPSGTYVDSDGVSYAFTQYLVFTNAANNGRIVYDQPTGSTAPDLGLKFAGSATGGIYNYKLLFTKQLAATYDATTLDVVKLKNTQLNILGKTWTVTKATATATNGLTLEMLAGKNSMTVTSEAPVTFDIAGKAYTVELVGVGTVDAVDAATVKATPGTGSAETLTIKTGQTKTLSDGTIIGVTSVFKPAVAGITQSATVFVGADKLKFSDSNMTDTTGVETGFTQGLEINGVSKSDYLVRMTGSSAAGAVTLNSLEVMYKPTLEQFVKTGTSLTDEAFSSSFKIFFGGLSPAVTDTTDRESIQIVPSGLTATVNFQTKEGKSLAQSFVYVNATGLGNIYLKDSGQYAIHILEGETIAQNEYAVVGQNAYAAGAQSPFGHILRFLTASLTASGTSKFQDIATGSTIEITGGNTSMYLDGQQYMVYVIDATHVQITWGTGATYANPGTAIDVYPAIETGKGALVSITTPVTTSLAPLGCALVNLSFPTGTVDVATAAGGYNKTALYTLEKTKFNVTSYNGSSTNCYATIRATDNSVTTFNTPGVFIVEGLNEAQVRDVIAERLDSATDLIRANLVIAPAFTSSVTASPGVSGTTQNRFVDVFGTYVTYDSTAPGQFNAMYPYSQGVATIGVGPDPAVTASGTAGSVTTEKITPVTADVAMLDSEVTDAVKTGSDIIVVGGPGVNQLAATLLDKTYPAYGEASGLTADTAMIKVFPDAFATGKTAVLIAGWEAKDTDLAARVLQIKQTDLATQNVAGVTVSGTIASPSITAMA